ncbi:helix-turn-helix domain-containing protein [Yoonia sp.]|uniref:helix-turn-helix domain-containing protein n=1 Tax=Yoonia sp. TaxID=2212373 RepID=UPI0019F97D52|nr:helix-turn-helix domain-containing protein [Yoonia sp.]MBE0414000.1 helix-turn-helix domain-containing protein [Yoonia sp.]
MYVTRPNEQIENFLLPLRARPVQQHHLHHICAGKHLFHEGQTARNIYEVVKGVLRLTRVMADGRRQVIAFGYPGDVVGFHSDDEYHTDCDALLSTTVIVHSRSALESPAGNSALHTKLLQAALHEISAMQDHFLMLGRKSAAERVASFLLTLQERVGMPLGQFTQFDLPMSRSDIADFLGMTTETVCRTLTRLRKLNIIALDRVHTVVILKPEALIKEAEGRD